LKVGGFKEKLATKIYTGIHGALEKATLPTLMTASNIFGRGFSDKKTMLILEAYPNIITSPEVQETKIQMVARIKGMALKTAEAFVVQIPAFREFLKECGLESKILPQQQQPSYTTQIGQPQGQATQSTIDTTNPLYKKTIVMTGTRDKVIIDILKNYGAILGSSVSKNTFAIIAKDKEDESGKTLDAKKLNIPIYSVDEFFNLYTFD